MKCKEVIGHIEDYRDGGLAEELRAKISAHLNGCAGCRRELELLGAEQRIYGAYAATLGNRLADESALWRKVSMRLDGREAAPSVTQRPAWIHDLFSFLTPRRLAYALALIILSVGGTLVTMSVLEERESGMVSNVSGPRDLESALRSIARAEREYEEAIRLLGGIVEKRKPTLDPDLVAELERNLRNIDESIAATRKAYREHPSDPELALYMLAAYAKKVELLQEIAT